MSATCPGCKATTRPGDSTCPFCFTELRVVTTPPLGFTGGLILRLDHCTVLGGAGYALRVGSEITVAFERDRALLWPDTGRADIETIPYVEIKSITIGGPGSVTTGGGFIGGGFGVEGALEGMAIALVLNALTTRAKIHTMIEIITLRGEIFLHYGKMESTALRIYLSPVFACLRDLDVSWVTDQLERMAALRDRQILSEDEFARLKQRLLASLSDVRTLGAQGAGSQPAQ